MASNFPNGVIVDGRNAGTAIPIRRAVRVATLIAGTLATSFENGDTIDGVVLATGDRILIKNQVSAVENGIYVVEASGAPFRDVDFEDGASVAGMIIPITGGTQAGSIWNCTNIFGSDVVGVNPITFVVAAGTGASGNVSGSGASIDNAVVRWDGVTGTVIQNSTVILSDTGSFTGIIDVGMSGDVRDGAGNELINFTSVVGAVNEIAITNAATGTNPVIGVTGGDINISLQYLSKGTGVHIFDNPTSAAEIRLLDNVGTDYFGMRPAAATTSYTVTMPATQGAFNTFLRNDGAGNLSWLANASGDVNGPGASTDNAIVRWDGASGTFIKNSSVIIDDSGNVSGVNNISMSGDILAGDDSELINFTHVKNAANEFAVTNALTGENPIIGTTGDDAEISLDYITAGEKSYHYFRAAKAEGEIRLLDTDHKEFVGLRAFKDIKTSYTLIFPNEQGQSGQVLINDGLGQFKWGTFGSGNVNGPGASTDNAIVRWDGGSGTVIQNSGVLLTDTNNITGVVNLGMAGDILDQNNNELINFTAVINAVNEIAISNAITATNPIISATGGDANISIEYLTKGTGVHIFDNPASAAEIRLRDLAGTDYFGIRPANATTSYSLTMPAAQGGANTFLQNNGSGVMSWVTNGNGNVMGPGSSTDNAIVRWDLATGTIIQNSGVILSDANSMSGIVNVGMSGDILDANGNELINFTGVASAVNEVAITNAATGTNPVIGVTGTDANISLEYLSKGTGVHIFDNDTIAAEIRLLDDVGTDYVGIKASGTTTSYTVTMPATQGAASTFLQNNGAGILSWVAGSSSSLTYYNTSVAGTTTTTNTAFTLLGGMTLTTPAAGTYMVWFSSSCEKSNNSGSYDFIISIDGGVSAADNSIRTYEPSVNARFQAATTQAVVTVTGAENIQVYFRRTGSGSITCDNRSLVAIRLA